MLVNFSFLLSLLAVVIASTQENRRESFAPENLSLSVKQFGRGLCGSSTYETLTSRCCNGRVVRALSRSDRCCGNTTHNPDISRCCNGQVVRVFSRNQRCCGIRTYNPDIARCCNGVVARTLSRSSRCCGTRLYNPYTSTCCNGQVRRSLLGSRRCWSDWCCDIHTYSLTFIRSCDVQVVAIWSRFLTEIDLPFNNFCRLNSFEANDVKLFGSLCNAQAFERRSLMTVQIFSSLTSIVPQFELPLRVMKS